jgi:carbamoylphosphate synthase large subunit
MEKPVVTLSERKCVPQKVPPHADVATGVTVCVARRRAAVVPRADVMMLCAGSSSIRRANAMGRQHRPRAALREPPFLG